MEQILNYIQQKYSPVSVIIYGSYANGTNDSSSDFDALVISCDHEQCHDTSFVGSIQLDIFVYPATFFDGDFDCQDFIQIFDGKIIVDCNGIGKSLQTHVLTYLRNRPRKTHAENQANIDWCVKMLERAKRCDAEGVFRWHWVLIDSLEIFCDLVQQPYLGPKKSLQWMEENHPAAFSCYKKALSEFSMESLTNWISYLKHLAEMVSPLPIQ